ncbi:ASKHA domain-containing protein [Sporomusa aerivorans]|uniref:ASKHA domain-containing protein n=1 Tax=Sporomusa aerivorans TaxID=204936 RepID=UPI00352BB61C
MSELEQRNSQIILEFQPAGKRVQAFAGQTILEAAQGLDLFEDGINAPCGGQGLCGRCLVRLVQGELSPPTVLEEQRITGERLAAGYRLACQAKLAGFCKIEIPASSVIGRQQLQVDGNRPAFIPDCPSKRYSISGLRPASIRYPYSLWGQLIKGLEEQHGLTGIKVDLDVLRRIDPIVADESMAVTVFQNRIVDVGTPQAACEPLGLAVDLGTTKIAAFLMRLDTGEMLDSEGLLNPQIAFGEDLMSRLAYAIGDKKQVGQMAAAAAGGINELAAILANRQGVEVARISRAVIVANTAMHHLLLGLPVRQLAFSPYVPAAVLPVETMAERLGLNLGSQAQVYMMPPVGGFVGGDHVAMIQASGIAEADGIVLGIDIGTNTEIVLAVNGRMVSSCSCASGPAFEGAHISQGMRAVNGAISEVNFRQQGQEVLWRTIGNYPPIGLCGSGLIDLIAELHQAGVIAPNGRLNPAHCRVRTEEGQAPEFVVVERPASGCERDIVLTQKDIGEIQLAKAAIASGVSILLSTLGVELSAVDKVVIAGAFGSFLRLESAIAIGMLPDLPLERFTQVGNAAGVGACMTLVSDSERRRAESLAGKIEHLDLAVLPAFKREFAKALKFPCLR